MIEVEYTGSRGDCTVRTFPAGVDVVEAGCLLVVKDAEKLSLGAFQSSKVVRWEVVNAADAEGGQPKKVSVAKTA